MDVGLSIRDMAKWCGLSAYTLRYYERAGLIRAVARASSGHRRYRAEDKDWIAFLRRLRATGMSIRQMAEFAKLRAQGEATIPNRKVLLEQHTKTVRTRIHALEEAERVLSAKIEHYRTLEQSMARVVLRQSKREQHHGKPIRKRSGKAEGDRRTARRAGR